MKVFRAFGLMMAVMGVLWFLSPSISGAADVCDGIDKDLLTKHIPFPFEKMVETKPLKDLNMCQVIILINGNNAPLYVPSTKDAVIAGDIFRNRTPLSRNVIDRIEAQSFDQYEKELTETVAFTYKPATPIKGLVYMITDPDCPYCEKAKEPIKRFADENGMEIKVIFYPLPFHPDAKDKSVKGICGGMDYNDYLAARYSGGLCKDGEEKIGRSLEMVRKLGVTGTPTFIGGNGRRVSGFIPEQLKSLL